MSFKGMSFALQVVLVIVVLLVVAFVVLGIFSSGTGAASVTITDWLTSIPRSIQNFLTPGGQTCSQQQGVLCTTAKGCATGSGPRFSSDSGGTTGQVCCVGVGIASACAP